MKKRPYYLGIVAVAMSLLFSSACGESLRNYLIDMNSYLDPQSRYYIEYVNKYGENLILDCRGCHSERAVDFYIARDPVASTLMRSSGSGHGRCPCR